MANQSTQFLPGDQLVPGATTALSEFQGFLGDCMEAASEIIYGVYHMANPSASHLNATVRDMISRFPGRVSSSGITGLRPVSAELALQGVPNTVVDDWRSALTQLQIRVSKPVELLLLNAGMLPGETPGLQGHGITVVGYSPSRSKFVVSDPNSVEARTGGFSFYSFADIARAQPSGAIVPDTPLVGGFNQFDITGAITGAYTALESSIIGLPQKAISAVMQSFYRAIHVNGPKDLIWRIVLIGLAVSMSLLAIMALASGQADRAIQTIGPLATAAG